MEFKSEKTKTDKNQEWWEAYVSFDNKKSWFPVGGGSSEKDVSLVIDWYKAKCSRVEPWG